MSIMPTTSEIAAVLDQLARGPALVRQVIYEVPPELRKRRPAPSVFLIPQGSVYDKVMANLEEIKARGGPVIAIVTEGDSEAAELADDVIRIPAVADFLQPIITAIPLQLVAYHAAILRGCDVDKPRNLAKSVTVE